MVQTRVDSFCEHHRRGVNLLLHVLGGWIFISMCLAIMTCFILSCKKKASSCQRKVVAVLCILYSIACVAYLGARDMVMFVLLAGVLYETTLQILNNIPIIHMIFFALVGYSLPYIGHVVMGEEELLNLAKINIQDVIVNAVFFFPQTLQCVSFAYLPADHPTYKT